MQQEVINQYAFALKAGQRYVKQAAADGEEPYPAVLDELTENVKIVRQESLGVIEIPTELIVGTKSAGRAEALAGNFMPLLASNTEFASKWMWLCEAHLGEGIREPIECFEYMGRFYVQEGNKRVSVLRSFGSPRIPGRVTRLIPEEADTPEYRVYKEFLAFYALSGVYGLDFRRSGSYRRLQAALGMEPDHVWTTEERRSFAAGYSHFREAVEKLGRPAVTPAAALLSWLELHSFREIKDSTVNQLVKALSEMWPDVNAQSGAEPIKLSTEPEEKGKGIVAKILTVARPDHIQAAFLYAFPPEQSAWTRAHEHGRLYLEQRLGAKVTTAVYRADGGEYYAAMEQAIADGAQIIFATTPAMIDDCRRIAAEYKSVKVLNCALSQPYTGVRMYYGRLYECKFLTGAIAGTMAENGDVGYIAPYPIIGAIAEINAFALGARLTNPRARVHLQWSCTEGDPLAALREEGIQVISNRDATNPLNAHWNLEWGTYKLAEDGSLQPLAVPCWNWGVLYEKIVLSVLNGGWDEEPAARAINYWWGLDTGVIDVQLSEELPAGVRSLVDILRSGICDGSVEPFRGKIYDRQGVLRCDGEQSLSLEQILAMDWLCDNVDGEIPPFEQILPRSRELVRRLGVYRDEIAPQKPEKQL